MPKQNTSDFELKPTKIVNGKKPFREIIMKKKKLAIGLLIVLLLFGGYKLLTGRKSKTAAEDAKVTTISVDKSYDFAALNNQAKQALTKIKLKVATVEKTNQVLVKDQAYTAKNNKLFLIVNLELKNEASIPLNILPGDLVRLTVSGDDENKFAPDLHNNLVLVAAISTKLDRIGFVIPQEAKKFKLHIGELEGKKEIITVDFPS